AIGTGCSITTPHTKSVLIQKNPRFYFIRFFSTRNLGSSAVERTRNRIKTWISICGFLSI
ncbi:hypothetical protein R0K20_14360, partial [Staphylococcus sp. SIMBA_130]